MSNKSILILLKERWEKILFITHGYDISDDLIGIVPDEFDYYANNENSIVIITSETHFESDDHFYQTPEFYNIPIFYLEMPIEKLNLMYETKKINQQQKWDEQTLKQKEILYEKLKAELGK